MGVEGTGRDGIPKVLGFTVTCGVALGGYNAEGRGLSRPHPIFC